ncbi:MAG: hypothetical protein KC561_12615 [Myxococcales bacterium]|nr:hypothetical protein [Myxococcales bacterium]
MGDRLIKREALRSEVHRITRPAGRATDLVVPKATVDAIRQAETLLSRLDQLRDSWRAEARAEGIREGLSEVQDLSADLRSKRQLLADEHHSLIVELAAEIARTVIGEWADEEPDLLASRVQATTERLRNAKWITVHVHPSVVRSPWAKGLADRLPESLECAVMADPSLSPAEAVIDSDLGCFSLRLSDQMNHIVRALLDETES